MFTIILLSILSIFGLYLYDKTGNQMSRMTLGFEPGHKPYAPQPTKPKKPIKEKFMHLMAIAKYSGDGVVMKSGKVQGTVFLNNGVIRVWHKTKTVRTAATNLVKGLLSGISTAYRSLTAAEIASWIAAVPDFIRKNALAEVKHLTSAQAYQRVNNILLSLGVAGVTTAPGVAIPQALTSLSGAASVGGSSFGLTINDIAGPLAALPANVYARLYATRQVGISKQRFSKSDYRLVAIYDPATASNPLDVYSDYINKFGALVLDQNIGIALELITYDSVNDLFAQAGRIYSSVQVAA